MDGFKNLLLVTLTIGVIGLWSNYLMLHDDYQEKISDLDKRVAILEDRVLR